ncbi:helix-turn-helix domain-containing protein, partial [Baaleninema sp.]
MSSEDETAQMTLRAFRYRFYPTPEQ